MEAMTSPQIDVNTLLSIVQAQIKAPKNEHNNFGNYAYRTAESILEAAKAVMPDGCSITLSEKIFIPEGSERIYVESTATFRFKDQSISTTAFAREPDLKKGMDVAQVTGMAISYARKYALCGLLAIDGNRDIDAMDNTREGDDSKDIEKFAAQIAEAETMDELKAVFMSINPRYRSALVQLKDQRKEYLTKKETKSEGTNAQD